MIGENGAVFQFGIELPPKQYEIYPYSKNAKEQRDRIKMLIDQKFSGKIWYQPNEVGLTPFPMDEDTFEELQNMLDEEKEALNELQIYRHIDCFDLVPKTINKYNGLEYLTKLLRIERKDVIAIGDGVNDIPMFEFADVAIGVGEKVERNCLEMSQRGDKVRKLNYIFSTIVEVLDFVKKEKM